MWKRRGRAVGLDTLMVRLRQVLSSLLLLRSIRGVQSGLLTPNERDRVESKAWKYKEKLPDKLVEKENVLKTATGRGLLLITISIIRHRYKISIATYTIYLNMICIDTYLRIDSANKY